MPKVLAGDSFAIGELNNGYSKTNNTQSVTHDSFIAVIHNRFQEPFSKEQSSLTDLNGPNTESQTDL
jgi:hypothetical protein